MQKDVYITQVSGITPHSQIRNQSKASLRSGARNTRRKIQSMASGNTEGNAMDENSKDCSIQPLVDNKQNPTV